MTPEALVAGKEGTRADLMGAYLRGAYLRGANLRGADLRDADLRRAYLRDADLRRANLRGADLWGANLRGADLRDADLRDADLRRADLMGADLWGADLMGAKLPHFQICPEEGAFIGWKKAGHAVLKLGIPAHAKRTSSLIGRKCRASEVKVLEAVNTKATEFTSERGGRYIVGQTTFPDKFCDDIRVECSHGIHFFMTRKEAEEW